MCVLIETLLNICEVILILGSRSYVVEGYKALYGVRN